MRDTIGRFPSGNGGDDIDPVAVVGQGLRDSAGIADDAGVGELVDVEPDPRRPRYHSTGLAERHASSGRRRRWKR